MPDRPGEQRPYHSLPGNEVALNIIARAASTGRVANAYLLKGPQGSPKDVIADRFAKVLLCESRTADGKACDICRSCRQVDAGQHPDLFQAEKEGASIKIKKSHEMLREALLKPYQSSRKVFLVKNAEDMTIEASNALLKVLEEPPTYVTFILTTSNPSAIPDTILSRCQIVPVRAFSAEALEKILVDGGADPEVARKAASLSGGSVERADRILARGPGALSRGEDILNEILSSSAVDLAQKYAKSEPAARLDFIDDLEIELSHRLRVAENGRAANLRAVGAVMKAKDRLGSSVNTFLTYVVLFFNLNRALRENDQLNTRGSV